MTAAAIEKPIAHYVRAAAADLSAKQYYACKLNSSENVALCSVAGERVDGILQNKPESGEHAKLMDHGITKAVMGGTVSTGDLLATDANGKLVVATSGTYHIARALFDGVASDIKGVRIERGIVPAIQLDHYVHLAGITDGDVLTNWTLGFPGVIESIEFIVDVPVTTGSKTTAIHAEIGATATTGGVLTITSAAATPLGKVIAGTAITAANTFLATSTLSLVAASTTQHAEGSGTIRLTVRNVAA